MFFNYSSLAYNSLKVEHLEGYIYSCASLAKDSLASIHM